MEVVSGQDESVLVPLNLGREPAGVRYRADEDDQGLERDSLSEAWWCQSRVRPSSLPVYSAW